MSDTTTSKGACICGAVTITAKSISLHAGACHCGTCRRWSAGPFLTVDCGTDVTVDGQENLGIYNSSDWAERAFCKDCGTNLFYRLKGTGQHFVSVSLFGDVDGIKMTHQVFVDERPSYYEFANETTNMTGAEVFAKFGG